ncbi:hypothetical protein WQ54_22740 [Bacillus sp. SA1-12]|uniref:ATP-binding protein n=1 Tax=Bacillus sp. SA1-12 TaxID=1455638 RepID=UPI0006272403|nr:sensor histidine kinase [Bacillus sp. SA1-12]KKI89961.1 hypothetical protein WQ54_22740 [Bacillus sp. SA1-12]
MELLKDIILQIAFIIFPIFIYHLFWLSRTHVQVIEPNKILISCSTILSSILCILYPIELAEGLYVNLQGIPLFISIVYGGFIPGILTMLPTLTYHLFQLNLEWYTAVLCVIVYCTLPYLLRIKWQSFGLKRKQGWAIVYGAFLFGFSLLFLGYESVLKNAFFSMKDLYIINAFNLVLAIILLVTIYLIEYTKENALIRMELVKAEKMSMVSELAASVAHEVRNPLTVVRGFVQLIGNSTDNNITQRKEYMNLVLAELDRAQSIITDYLGLASQQYIAKEKIDLAETLEEIKTLMTSYANFKTVTINGNINKDLYVIGDHAKLKQVFINIIKNAIEAVPNVDGKVSIQAYVSHEFVRIKIMDNGIGMSQEQIARIGEPYFTLKEKGTGLGLTVTYSIIKNHGGTIRYKSELNKGTIAMVSLPYFVSDNEQDAG